MKKIELWKEGETIHIRYREVSKQSYCPAAIKEFPNPMIFTVNVPATHIKHIRNSSGKTFVGTYAIIETNWALNTDFEFKSTSYRASRIFFSYLDLLLRTCFAYSIRV